jgi:hypothetical protein
MHQVLQHLETPERRSIKRIKLDKKGKKPACKRGLFPTKKENKIHKYIDLSADDQV